MATPPRILFDLNVILDVLQRRAPHYEASAGALAAAETGRVIGLVAAHSLTTLFYLASRSHSSATAKVMLSDLLRILSVAGVRQSESEQALALPYDDFEDATQMAAAVGAGAEYIVTRDLDGFRAGPLRAIRPAELPALLIGIEE